MNVRFCGVTAFPIKQCNAHMHKTWELIYQLTGENRSQIGTSDYNIIPGDILIVPPKTPHGGASDGEYTDIFIQADSADFRNELVVHDYDGNIRKLFLMLHKEFVEKNNNYENICNSLFESICQYIKKYISVSCKHAFVYDVKNYIYENISNADFKISQISSYAGYNIDYVRRRFVEETGKTPQKYLSDLRLSLAKRLLLQESFVSIEDVAAKCGFYDSFYFSTFFRRKIGLSPGAYRRKFNN